MTTFPWMNSLLSRTALISLVKQWFVSYSNLDKIVLFITPVLFFTFSIDLVSHIFKPDFISNFSCLLKSFLFSIPLCKLNWVDKTIWKLSLVVLVKRHKTLPYRDRLPNMVDPPAAWFVMEDVLG